MSRQASRRPEAVTTGKPIPPQVEAGTTPGGGDSAPGPAPVPSRRWLFVLWLWAAAFMVLLLSEIILFCLRKLG